ncbi:MAG: hypothetical protein ACR2J8_07630, partial [Thermomicrobiales bacterium]
MDHHRFDETSRQLAAAMSRRRGLAAGIAALAGALRAIPAAAAPGQCRSHHAEDPRCDRDADCCSGLCRGRKCRCLNRSLPCERTVDCCDGLLCRDGHCGDPEPSPRTA